MNEERHSRYRKAIADEVNHGDVTCEDAASAVIAIADEEQAELRAEVKRLRISPDHIEELLGIDPNDPLHMVAKVAVEWRKDAESAEAEVARLTRLLEQRTAALTRTIDAKNAAEAKVARVRAASRQNAVQATALARRTDRALNALDALIETVERDDSGEPVCHDYDRIDNGECALLADLRRIKAALTPKETA